MSVTERNPTLVAGCGCPYDPGYDEGSLGWHLSENHIPGDDHVPERRRRQDGTRTRRV
jgi:hypothetical protein